VELGEGLMMLAVEEEVQQEKIVSCCPLMEVVVVDFQALVVEEDCDSALVDLLVQVG